MGVIRRSLVKENGVNPEVANAVLSEWDIKPIIYQGVEVGEYMMQKKEIHFAINEDRRLKLGRRGLIKKVLSELLEEHDFLVTKLFKNMKKDRRLIEFFGFRHTHSDAEFDYFWLDKETCKCLP